MDNELFELCKEVYKRFPEWNGLRDWYWGNHVKGGGIKYDLKLNAPVDKIGRDDIPLYTSDYLLEKLLPHTAIHLFKKSNGNIACIFQPPKPIYEDIEGGSAVIALLKTVIALDDAKELK